MAVDVKTALADFKAALKVLGKQPAHAGAIRDGLRALFDFLNAVEATGAPAEDHRLHKAVYVTRTHWEKVASDPAKMFTAEVGTSLGNVLPSLERMLDKLPEKGPKRVKRAGFSVINTGAFHPGHVDNVLKVLDRVEASLRRRGFDELLYGDLQLVRGDQLRTTAQHAGAVYRSKHDDLMVDPLALDSDVRDLAFRLTHELGHRLWYRFLTEDQRMTWVESWREAKDFVSTYARTSPAEDFAETMATWCISVLTGEPLQRFKALKTMLGETISGQAITAFKKPYDGWKNLKKGRQEAPTPLIDSPNIWAKIAARVDHDVDRGVIQKAPVIGGRRRYHHRPLTSWLLSDGDVLTITTDEMEAKVWNHLKAKRHPAMPRVFDVFSIRKKGESKASMWGIVHERLTWPPDDDWVLFVDTFFRWRAMQKDALQPADEKDLEDFLRFIVDPEQSDPKTVQRRRIETVLPFPMKKERRQDVAMRRAYIFKGQDLEGKIAWAKSALRYLKQNRVRFRDFDPSNLGKTVKGGRTVITNLAESRSAQRRTGRYGSVRGAFLAAGLPMEDQEVFRSFLKKKWALGKWLQTDGLVLNREGADEREPIASWNGSKLVLTKSPKNKSLLQALVLLVTKLRIPFEFGPAMTAASANVFTSSARVIAATSLANAYTAHPEAVVMAIVSGNLISAETGEAQKLCLSTQKALEVLQRIARHLERDVQALSEECDVRPPPPEVAASLKKLAEDLERAYKKTASKLVSLR